MVLFERKDDCVLIGSLLEGIIIPGYDPCMVYLSTFVWVYIPYMDPVGFKFIQALTEHRCELGSWWSDGHVIPSQFQKIPWAGPSA